MYKFKITEQHGMVEGKFFIKNRNNPSLCMLDNHPATNTGLPVVFDTEEEAQHYLSLVEDAEDAVITPTQVHFFDHGYALYKEDPDGINIFGFGGD